MWTLIDTNHDGIRAKATLGDGENTCVLQTRTQPELNDLIESFLNKLNQGE